MKVILFACIIFHHLFCKSHSDPAHGGYRTAIATSGGDDGGENGPEPAPESCPVEECPPPPPPPPPPSPDTFSTDSNPSLTIYYDAMEENSQKYFKTIPLKQFSSFFSHINITFVPCQEAYDDTVGSLTCFAKADTSCKVDKMHSCAISRITDKMLLLNYLICTMSNVEKLPDFPKCAGPSKANDDDLQKCANVDEGKNLCTDYSKKILQRLPLYTLPVFIFKPPGDIKPDDSYEHMDYYRRGVCMKDIQSAVCAKLVASKASNVPEECKKKLVLGVFYKAMHDNSQKWFQLISKIYDEFSDYLALQYRPCMQAEMSADGVLDCKDELDKDCTAGKTHACAASLVQDPKSLFHFLSCTMKDSASLPDFQKCATDNGVQYDPIKQCASTDEGKQLCVASSKTRPIFDDIPAFSYELTFDGDTSKKTAEATDQTLKTILCDQFKKYGMVNPCDQQNKSTTSNALPNVPPTSIVQPAPSSNT